MDRTREQTKKDTVETISILCDYLDTDRLVQVWKKVFALAEEQWQAEREREKGAPVGLRKIAG